MREGERVEARRTCGFEDTDKLFVPGTLLSVSGKSCAVRFDDGSVDDDVPHEWVQRPSEEVLFAQSAVTVSLGRFGDSKCLILRFDGEHIVQAVALLDGSNPSRIRPDPPWEINQALCLSACLASTSGPLDACILGVGAGSIPRALAEIFPPSGVLMRGAESSEAVLRAAREHFGLLELPNLSVSCERAQEFIRSLPERSQNCILVDVVESESVEDGDVMFPPRDFTTTRAIEKVVKPKLRRGGVYALNAAGGRRGLRELSIALERCFPAVYVIATDPNYVFLACNDGDWKCTSPADVCRFIDDHPRLASLVAGVRSFIERTDELASAGILIGWFSPSRFRRMLEDTSVVA